MSFNSSSGTVNVTGNVTAVSPTPTAVTTVAGETTTGDVDVLIATVPANRRWIIVGLTLSGCVGAGIGIATCPRLLFDGQIVAKLGVAIGNETVSIDRDKSQPIAILTAGKEMWVYGFSGYWTCAQIRYYEEVV